MPYKEASLPPEWNRGSETDILENDNNSGGKIHLQGLNLSNCNSSGVLIQSRDPEQYSFACVTLSVLLQIL